MFPQSHQDNTVAAVDVTAASAPAPETDPETVTPATTPAVADPDPAGSDVQPPAAAGDDAPVPPAADDDDQLVMAYLQDAVASLQAAIRILTP